ncbi:hypothetical protein SY88_13075 [Clostridiales bacterium PH28_bin88]|nr:hypothetical protein SY88_13075 [Clostridiales bacterium PH28_bin88]
MRAVERAIEVLNCFSLEHPDLGISEIAAMLKLHKSTVHRILVTMELHGLVEQDLNSGKYRLGLKLFEWGHLVITQKDIIREAKTYLRELANRCRLTVHLSVLAGGEVFYLDKLECSTALISYTNVGKRAPFHCTAMGKVLTAGMPGEELDRLVEEKGLQRYTPNTIVLPEDLREHLRRVREQGYAVDREEIQAGLRCVAAPILNHEGKVVAALSASGLAADIPDERIPVLAKEVMETASKVSCRLGYPRNPEIKRGCV